MAEAASETGAEAEEVDSETVIVVAAVCSPPVCIFFFSFVLYALFLGVVLVGYTCHMQCCLSRS